MCYLDADMNVFRSFILLGQFLGSIGYGKNWSNWFASQILLKTILDFSGGVFFGVTSEFMG